jgi:hypothetical protein
MEHASSTRHGMQHTVTQQGHEHNGQDGMPLIDALDGTDQTSLPTTSAKKTPSDALRKIKAQETLIKKLQRQLQNTSEALIDSEQNKTELNELLHATLNSPGPTRPLETSGPHRLQERAQRPEDIEYQERLRQQTTQEQQTYDQQALAPSVLIPRSTKSYTTSLPCYVQKAQPSHTSTNWQNLMVGGQASSSS